MLYVNVVGDPFVFKWGVVKNFVNSYVRKFACSFFSVLRVYMGVH